MIREVQREEIPDCVSLIKKAFLTVADEFGFTEENAPRFTAFATNEERLLWQMDGDTDLWWNYKNQVVINVFVISYPPVRSFGQ